MSVALTEKQTREIEAFCRIARENGAAISLRELIGLASIDVDEPELERAFLSDSTLRSKFLLDSGYVLERSGATEVAAREDARRERARANLERARTFGALLARGAVLVSVSGANAYLSAAEGDDIDFFCVTRTDGMWLFLLRALLTARVHRLANKDVPELCFSCIMDEAWAKEVFGTRQQPIFARDALTARVIGGGAAYGALLEGAPWMAGYFPALYETRLAESSPEERRLDERRGHAVLNAFLYHTLGSFLRIKSWSLNRRFSKASRRSSVFATKLGAGHYIYESNRYRSLGRMYGELEKDG